MCEFNCFPSEAKTGLEWSGSETAICFPDAANSAVFLLSAALSHEGRPTKQGTNWSQRQGVRADL